MNLTQAIKDKALESGFDHVGICSAAPLDKERYLLQEWLIQGYAAGMHYMKASFEKRVSPASLMEGARSIICLGKHYSPVKQSFPFKIASYAHTKDYHQTLKLPLQRIEDYIDELTEKQVNKISFIDSGPLLEKAYAKKAGLGFQGKNTNLIHPAKGSYFFLAEIIVDIELEFDRPLNISCGTCNKCVESCPTGALDKPYWLDSNKCISYLTIENKSAIPPELREKVGDWIFGCDICQDVCPFNRKAPSQSERENCPEITLQSLLEIPSEKKFKERYNEWPVIRAKKTGLIRNILNASGNLRIINDFTQIRNLADSSDSEIIKEQAHWTLERIKPVES